MPVFLLFNSCKVLNETFISVNHLCVWRYPLCKSIISVHIKNMHTNSSSRLIFLPPSLEWGLGDKACALLHTVQSAPRCLPSCGSRCPGLRLALLILAGQSPGEWSTLLGVKRCSGVGTTWGAGVRPRHQRAEGTLGPLPGPRKAQDHHQSRIHRLRCQTGKGRTHRHHHLWKTQRVSTWEWRSVASLWLLDYHKLTAARGYISFHSLKSSCNTDKSSKKSLSPSTAEDKRVKHTISTWINLICSNKQHQVLQVWNNMVSCVCFHWAQ